MASYVPITDAEIQPERPATTGLFARLRDNAIAIAQGALGAPRVRPLVFIAVDARGAGVPGDNSTAGSFITKTLNTLKNNEIVGASLVSNQIILPAGIYDVEAYAHAYEINSHQMSFYNVTDAVHTLQGMTQYTNSGSHNSHMGMVKGRFTIASAKTFELRHWCSQSVIGGFGLANLIVGAAPTNIYTFLRIEQVG